MKKNNAVKGLIPRLLIILCSNFAVLSAPAYDFSAVNDDGVTIYYEIRNDETVSVTNNGDYPYSDSYSGDVVIPSEVIYLDTTYSVTGIGPSAFYGCTGLTSVEIPNAVTYISYEAFYGCTGLTSIKIGSSVTDIGAHAFAKCTNLKEVVLEDGDATLAIYDCYVFVDTQIETLYVGRNISYRSDYDYISGNVTPFNNNPSLNTLTIGDLVTEIGFCEFSRCTGLTSVEIPNSVTLIGAGAFEGCTGLTSLEIPNSVTLIGAGAFEGCTGLTSLEIPNSVTTIGDRAFQGATGITSIVFAEGNNSIDFGNRVFNEVPIETVYLGRDFTINDSEYAPFFNKTTINSLTISDSVTSLSDFAFSGCTGLTSVEFPASVINIGKKAFKDCSGLTDVRFPWDLENIGLSAFENCVGLTEISLGFSNDNEATYSSSNIKLLLGANAFKGCLRLRDLTLGTNISSIGMNAFGGDWQLATITVENPDPVDITLGQNVFDGVDHQTCELKVPIGSIALYSAAPQWKEFTNIQETVVKKSQEILWDQTFEDVKVGDVLILTAETTSGLSVEYTISLGSDIATLEGNKLKIIGTGTVEITASQDGNDTYKPAEPVVKRIDNIIDGTAIVMMDNNSDVIVFNLHGQILYQGKAMKMPRFTPGAYIIRCGDKTVKVRM